MSYTRGMTCRIASLMVLFLGVSSGPGWSQEKPRSSAESAELYRELEFGKMDPYLAPYFFATTPQPQGRDMGFVIRQVNVTPGQLNILNDAANEPSITIDPNNPLRISVGWRQFDNIASNFRQAGFAWSNDGGMTWNKSTINPGVFRSDPVLDSTTAGIFHYNSLQNTFFTDQYISTDYGQTWGSPNYATGGDKQWITIDKTNGIGAGNVYQIWSTAGNNFSGRQFSRSTNGGTTWSDPISLPTSPIWGTLDVGPDGTLYIGGTNGGATMRFVRSSNAKDPSVTPTFDLTRNPNMGGSVEFQAAFNPGGLSGQMSMCADRSNGPTRGNIYMLHSLRVNATNPTDVMFIRSTNKGSTWSTAKRVNDDPQGQSKVHWFGTLACAPNGRLDAVWLDNRNAPAGSFNSMLYRSYSLDGGLTWSVNEAVSPAFDPVIGWPNQNKIGDYLGLVSDANGAHCAFPSTLSGGQDVYYVYLPAPKIFLRGTVALGNFLPGPGGQSVSVEVRNAGGTVIDSGSTTLAADGTFAYEMISANVGGPYTVRVRGSHWLWKSGPSVSMLPLTGFTLPGTISLINGDANADNTVDLLDYFALSDSYNLSVGDAGFNANADFNGDTSVDLLDYFILSDNYLLDGDV